MPTVADRTMPPMPARITAASRRPAGLGLTPAGSISLAMGEPDAATAAPIARAAVDALRHGRTRYEPLTGSPALRAALADHVEGGTGRATGVDEIVVTHGGTAGLAAVALALLSPGDLVLVPEPTYSLYSDHVAMAGAEQRWVAPGPDGRIDFAALEASAADARMIMLCNPVNPTGMVLTPDELTALADLLRRHPSLLLVSDEAYADIVFDDAPFTSALSLAEVRDQVIMVGTFSKSYAMTGWRLGYVVAEAEKAAHVNLVHRTLNGSLATFVQDAGIIALQTPRDVLDEMRAGYQRRRDLVWDALSDIPGVALVRPAGAFYAFPRVDVGFSSTELVARLAQAGVLLRAGSEYGPSGEGHVRLSFATDDDSLRAGLSRIRDVLARVPAG